LLKKLFVFFYYADCEGDSEMSVEKSSVSVEMSVEISATSVETPETRVEMPEKSNH